MNLGHELQGGSINALEGFEMKKIGIGAIQTTR